MSFEDLHLDFKSKGLVETEEETEVALQLLCFEGKLEKQAMKNSNQIWYRRLQ